MTTIGALLDAVEPREPRPLDELIALLDARGRLRAVIAAPAGGASDSRSGVPGRPVGVGGALVTGGITDDSRAVRPGGIFVAIRGAHVDGHAFVPAAVGAGAVAAIVEDPVPTAMPGLVQLVVDRSQPALADAAAWWYGDPSRDLGVVGITGTDGKTSTALLAVAALEAAGVRCGLIGTVATQIGGLREANAAHATTPAAPRLQAAIRAMVAAGDRAAVVETTSHGLAQERVGGIDYDVAVFTNLSHEHLEFHGSFEAYRAAKVSLFERLATGPRNPPKPAIGWPRTGIVNADDPAGPIFAAATRAANARLLTYGRAGDADVRILDVVQEAGSLRVGYEAEGRPGTLRLRLAGRFNAHNALAVVAVGMALGLDAGAVRAGLETLPAVPGRMDRIEAGQPFDVVVDYAHSPASLELVLDELGPEALARGGGLMAVFGSAGERDRAKRPMMGRIAGERCRLLVITDEDPRGENRQSILEEIAAGAVATGRVVGEDVLLIADRRAAIREAIARARPGDVVLLAGKGHEATILYADHQQPWDERSEALAALAEQGWSAAD